ncbi:MAG TPA: outer membrane protein assembly factor BamB [Candidatus Competibacteraceae bacterium]|nr:outer membrane protein assembly factor BamB [Candidatus Competibacteraceae bacterium]
MRRAGLASLVFLLGLNAGCSWVGDYIRGSDNTTPPTPLTEIVQSVSVQRVWQTDVGSGSQGSYVRLVPAVAQGRVYAAGRDGEVLALDAASGNAVWRIDTELSISAGVGLGDGLILVGTDKGEVLALRAENGTEAWRAKVSSEVLAAPRAAGGVTVVRSGDGRFTGLDSRTGERRWVYSYTLPALTLRGAAAPLLGEGVAISGLDNGKLLVLALNNGAPVWEKSIAPPRGRTDLERMVDIDSEPRLAGDVLYAAAYQGNVSAIDLSNGNLLWSRDFSSHAGLAVDARQVYLADEDDQIWALDRRNGATLWKQDGLKGRRLSTPVVQGEYVVFGDFEGYLHWLSRDDGRMVGRVRADGAGIAALQVVDGVLYALGRGGSLGAYRIGG